MTEDERRAIAVVFVNGCDLKLPADVHIPLEILRRELEKPLVEILDPLRGCRVFGIEVSVEETSDDYLDESTPRLTWGTAIVVDDDTKQAAEQEYYDTEGTAVAAAMFRVLQHRNYCLLCNPETLRHLDFSALATPAPDPVVLR